MPKKKPEPKKYFNDKEHIGWRVNFEYPKGTPHRLRFRNDQYDNPFQAALDYIDKTLVGQPGTKTSIKAVIGNYFSWSEKTGQKKYKTIKVQQSRLGVYLNWATGNNIKFLEQININTIRDFQDYYFDNYPFYKNNRKLPDLSKSELDRRRRVTWDKYRLNLSAFFNFCVDRDLIKSNPIAGKKEFKVKMQEQEPRCFEDNEWQKLLEYFDDSDNIYVKTWYRFLLFTGLRLSEALNLRWKSVNLKQKIIRISGETKSYHNRTIPISNKLLPYLENLPQGKGNKYVFSNGKNGRCCNGDSWYKRLQTAMRATGVEQAGLHAFRHTFASGLARAGSHPKEIQELLGHATEKMAMRYVHFYSSHLRSSIDKLPF